MFWSYISGEMAYALAQKLAANALVESGQSRRAVARSLKVSPNSVSAWCRDKGARILKSNEIAQIKNTLAGLTYQQALNAQFKVTDDKLDAMDAYKLTLISSINIDKARLIEGLSTENISHHSVIQNLESDRQKLSAALDAFKQ